MEENCMHGKVHHLTTYVPLYYFSADVVYLQQKSISLRLPHNATAGDRVFDMKSVIVVDRENFVKSLLRFYILSRDFKFDIKWVCIMWQIANLAQFLNNIVQSYEWMIFLVVLSLQLFSLKKVRVLWPKRQQDKPVFHTLESESPIFLSLQLIINSR